MHFYNKFIVFNNYSSLSMVFNKILFDCIFLDNCHNVPHADETLIKVALISYQNVILIYLCLHVRIQLSKDSLWLQSNGYLRIVLQAD